MSAFPDDSDLSHFHAIPWCASLLLAPDVTVLPTPSNCRSLKPSTEDALFALTLNTDDTISALLYFHKRPPPGQKRIDEISALMTLGYRLNGFANVVHGGIIVTIIDEAMGFFLGQNIERGAFLSMGDVMTADLRVRFLRPVATPQTVCISVRFREVKGRKYFVEADLKDGEGTVLAKGEALWISAKSAL